MLLESRHDRLRNAVIYFVENTVDCTADKLMHLLYLLDFEHYKATGRSVTGKAYCAMAAGPLSPEVFYALDAQAGLPTILDEVLDMSAWRATRTLAAIGKFQDDDLTPRQLRLLENLARTYAQDNQGLQSVVRARGGPWCKTYRRGAGLQACIAYELALEGLPNRELILESALEHEMRLAARASSASC